MRTLTWFFAASLVLLGGFMILTAFGAAPGQSRGRADAASGCFRWIFLFFGVDALLSGFMLFLVFYGWIESPW